jgi:protein phosphatase 2C-like protein
VLLASEPGEAGRPNEDFAAVAPGAAVLLDGAGYAADTKTGCAHGVAWYTRTLGGLLAARASDTAISLSEVLGQGIEQVRQMHEGTCDLRHPDTPGATVIVARQCGEDLEYLVLCDSVLLLQPRHGGPRAISDPRLGQLIARHRPSRDLPAGTPEHDAAWHAYAQRLAQARNRPGGFWLAAADPVAAAHALTGREPIRALAAVALLSDGATRLADRFHLATWAGICATLAEQGPAGLIRQVRDTEATDPSGQRWPRRKIHDDATAVYWPLD